MMRKLDLKVILRNTGEVLEWFSLVFIVPIVYALLFEFSWKTLAAFILPMTFTAALGLFLKKAFDTKFPSQSKHALAAVLIVWIIACFLAGLPFTIGLNKSLTDSTFQATSALTTTGLDIFHGSPVNMSTIPRTYVLWINFLSWIGGAGIVMIALVGLISIFESSKLAMAEGREERIRPNLVHTSKIIWEIYGAITAVGAFLLWLVGLKPFDAINYAMSAISTTGFTTGDATIITNPAVASVLSFLLIMGAISFFAHYMVYKKDKSYYFKDTQVLGLLALIIIGFFLVLPGMVNLFGTSGFKLALFNVIGALTCGAFVTNSLKPLLLSNQFVLLVLGALMFIGGSAGSTSGGIKISRFIIFLKTLYWKIKKLALPENAVVVRKYEGKLLKQKVVEDVLLFITLYGLFIFLGTLVLSMSGYNLVDSAFEVISAQSNAGMSLITNASMPWIAKITLIINMIVGRLEIIPLLTVIGYIIDTRWRL